MKIIWSPLARRRAEAAVDIISRDRPKAALEWYDGLVSRIELLRHMPEQGRVVKEWHDPTVREILHDPYRIIYEVFTDRVEIITLHHYRQDFSAGIEEIET